MTEDSEAPGRGYFRAGLLSERKTKTAAARYSSRRSGSFFPVKSGVPVQLELKAETALDTVLDFDVGTKVLLCVNVERTVF